MGAVDFDTDAGPALLNAAGLAAAASVFLYSPHSTLRQKMPKTWAAMSLAAGLGGFYHGKKAFEHGAKAHNTRRTNRKD